MSAVFAASLSANVYFGIFLAVFLFAVVYGYFTVSGSGINSHPIDGRGGAPGSKLPDQFRQFADRQLHDRDMRVAERDRRVAARLAQIDAVTPRPRPTPALATDEMTIDEINARLAAESRARKATHSGSEVEETSAR